MPRNKQITSLNAAGQAIWFDNLSRELLRTGELKELIASGVEGLTSNPTIFKKAIADSSNYDAELKKLSHSGLGVEGICEELMLQDVAAAADLLKSVFQQTGGSEGYASIEVSPTLADDTEGTVKAAKRIWEKLARPNIMIKVPATPAGIPAIRELLIAGINVNVTLIFGVSVYEKVAEAYLQALETRLSRSEELTRLTSVASFFVSRVDAICEEKFETLVQDKKNQEQDQKLFLGQVGIANCKQAYSRFSELFFSERFERLRTKGAKTQRLLWASTGVKNPALPKLLYVENLIARDTVNTVPPDTLKLLMEQVNTNIRLDKVAIDPESVFKSLTKLGIDLEVLLRQLESDGVRLFANSYTELIRAIRQKVENNQVKSVS